MATAQFFDRYQSTLASPVPTGTSTLIVASTGSGASALPASGDYWVVVEAEGSNTEEVFRCTGRTSTTLAVTGAQAGTAASNHASGAVIRGAMLTADTIAQLKLDAGISVQDEGVALTPRAILNFTGAGVTVTDDAANNRTVVTIAGGGAAGGFLRAVANAGVLDAASPFSPSRGSGNHRCRIFTLPLVAGNYTRVVVQGLTFDGYIYIRRPDGTLFFEADSESYAWTPDASGDWTYEVTSYNPNNFGSFLIRWNRVPLASEVPLSGAGNHPASIGTGWLSPASMNGVWAAWFRFTANGSVTVNVTSEEFDDYLYLADSALAIIAEADNPPITQTLAAGTYFAIVRPFSAGYYGAGIFSLSGAVTS